jgi:hypothetical protein
MNIAIAVVVIMLGLGVLANVRNYPRIYYQAMTKTYSDMSNHWWSRISRSNMWPWAVMPCSWFRLLIGGALVVGGLIGLISAI